MFVYLSVLSSSNHIISLNNSIFHLIIYKIKFDRQSQVNLFDNPPNLKKFPKLSQLKGKDKLYFINFSY